MPLKDKPLDLIEESDLQALKETGVFERKYLEYKRCLPGDSDDEKREFLADVSSFANAAGGDLIYGIREEDGAAVELCGLGAISPDQEILRLENLVRDGIEPRIPGVSISRVALKAGGVAIIVRVPRSWALPHVVKFKKHWRFHSRNSAGKYPLDMSEVRALFALSETLPERMRNFRAERLSRIVAGETPVRLADGAKIVLHLVPFGAFDPSSRFDVARLADKPDQLNPIGSTLAHCRHNFDGLLTWDDFESRTAISYVQLFRTGALEAVDAGILPSTREERWIRGNFLEQKLVESFARYSATQEGLGAQPPVVVMLSLLGVSGYAMWRDQDHRCLLPHSQVVDRDALLVPEIMLESYKCHAANALRPAFDAVWNAAGYRGSPNYDKGGTWKLRPG